MDNFRILGVSSEPAETDSAGGETQQVISQQSDPNNGGTVSPKQPPNVWGQLILFGVIFFVMYLLLFRGPRKQKQQHKQMVQTLKKNDRVRTVGGIIGTVVDIRDDEVVLKVDESNNTKIRVVKSAIGVNMAEKKES